MRQGARSQPGITETMRPDSSSSTTWRKREVDGDASVLQEKFLERDLVVRDEDVLPFEDLRLDPVPVEASHGIEVDGAKQQSRVAHKVGRVFAACRVASGMRASRGRRWR